MDVWEAYGRWCEKTASDPEMTAELCAMRTDQAWMEDAFYRHLAFGTGGLRGVCGAGTNRMNVYTVARASQGLSHDLNRRFGGGGCRVAVGYDTRMQSELFARTAAEVFAANGIEVRLYPRPLPVPCLSFAVRELRCAAGVMITASHNPAQYNGYKVYGADGCQITTGAAEDILAEIERLDDFDGVERLPFDEGIADGRISYLSDDVLDAYLACVLRQSPTEEKTGRDAAVVFTPLHGTGLTPVTRVLAAAGFSRVSVVPEQAQPDGRFLTCPSPNPELPEALLPGMRYAGRLGAELLIATDPDCDRVGAAVFDGTAFVRLSGNEIGVLLLDDICAQRVRRGTMPKDPVLIKTIVTTDMAEKIAAHYGVRTVNVLTGFKFIGEQIGLLEQAGRVDDFLFGFEESCGYLSGPYVRDKDGVSGALLICELFARCRAAGVRLTDRLNELYAAYGYHLNTLDAHEFPGATGFHNMQRIMRVFRGGVASLGGRRVEQTVDYAAGVDGLPCSDVLKLRLDGGSSVVVRPSGTEPKLKIYVAVCAETRADAARVSERIRSDVDEIIRNA